jgi:GDP-L-fucose synthase
VIEGHSSEAGFDLAGKRVFVAGHRGMVGAAIVRRLQRENCIILTAERRELDLTRQDSVERWMAAYRPEAIFAAAAKVGGILANKVYPANFIYENIAIETNIIHAAYHSGVTKLLFLGSSCIYPKLAPQPINEDALLTGPLEETNEWYAIAKIAGVKLCQAYRRQYGSDFISAMPTNLYGPGDNFDLENAHVLPALIRKMHEAKELKKHEAQIWGSGAVLREFLHVDDCADALVHIMKVYSDAQHINIGCGTDLSILDLARLIARVVGFKGAIVHDLSKPDGTPRKLLSVEKLRGLGWRPTTGLEEGIRSTYSWFLENRACKPPSKRIPRSMHLVDGRSAQAGSRTGRCPPLNSQR